MGITSKSVRVSQTVTIDPNVVRGARYTGILDLSELKKKLEGNFSIALASKFPMYKWFPAPDERKVHCHALYYEPPTDIHALKAATLNNGLNNLLLSNLPSWIALPDKETSAKVNSCRNTAIEYSKKSGTEENYSGNLYIAVPELNSRLVIAPTAHTRYAFTYALGEFGIGDVEYGSLGKLNGCFHELFRACGIEGEFPTDWQQFLTTLDNIASGKILPARQVSKDTEKVLGVLTNNKTKILNFLDNTFSPLNNGFKILDYNDTLKKDEFPDNEIWTASPCLLIEENLFAEMAASPD